MTNQVEVVRIATGSMRVLWDAPIEMNDGTILRADVFLPDEDGKYPVVITLGPYAKGLSLKSILLDPSGQEEPLSVFQGA